jgi:hypothetical protein
MEDLWEDLLAAIFGALFEIKEEIWDSVSSMYFETLYSYFNDSAGPLNDAFMALVMASYVGVVVAAGIILLSHETLQTKYTLRELLPRLVIAILLVGLAKEITWQVYATHLSLADAFTLTDRVNSVTCENFPEGSATPIDIAECEGYGSVMRSEFANHAFMVATGPNAEDPVGLVDIGMQLVSIWVYVTLFVIFLMRNIAWFCVLIMAPLALACHSLPQLERFAHYWWRLLGACLASSIGQCALIWIYHQLDGEIQFDDSGNVKYVDDYNLLLFYLVLITWLMWKLHKTVFQLARGKTVTAPGSGFLKYLLLNRLMNGPSRKGKSGKTRRRRSRADHDDDSGPSMNLRPSHPKPVRRYPETSGQRKHADFRNQADAFHAEHGTQPGGPVESAAGADSTTHSSSANTKAPAPIAAPTPADVAGRIEHREKVQETPKPVQEWEQFRRQADAFHSHRQEIARRKQRDAGAVRRRDRGADAVDLLVDEPSRAWGRGNPRGTGGAVPRRAGRPGQSAMPRAHRGGCDDAAPILPTYGLPQDVNNPSGAEANEGGGAKGGKGKHAGGAP